MRNPLCTMTDVWPSFGNLPHFPPFGGGEPPRDPAVDDWFLEARSMTLDLLTVVESLRAVLSNVDMALRGHSSMIRTNTFPISKVVHKFNSLLSRDSSPCRGLSRSLTRNDCQKRQRVRALHDLASHVASVTRWIRANFPPKLMKFPQFFPTILRIPNSFVKFPKPIKSRIYYNK